MDLPVNQYEAAIRQFIDDNLAPPEPGQPLPADLSLMEAGIMDSMGVLLLVTWLEQEFELIVDDDEVVPGNLDSIAAIDAFIARKRALEPAQ